MAWFYEDSDYMQEAKSQLRPDEALNLGVFLDRSAMEVFVNDRLCLTHRMYATRDDSKGVAFFAKSGAVKIPNLDAWKMHPSNPWSLKLIVPH